MAIAYIYPDATTTNNDWTVDAGNTLHGTLATTDFSLPTPDDDDDITTTTDGANFLVTLEDFSFSSNNVDSINSITVEGLHYNVSKGTTNTYSVVIENASGTDYYVETSSNIAPSDSYTAWNLTSRTTSDGSAAWTEANINGLRLVVTGNISGGEMRLNYLRIKIDYNIPIPRYESDEPNMNVEEGIVTVDEGIIIL